MDTYKDRITGEAIHNPEAYYADYAEAAYGDNVDKLPPIQSEQVKQAFLAGVESVFRFLELAIVKGSDPANDAEILYNFRLKSRDMALAMIVEALEGKRFHVEHKEEEAQGDNA